MFEFNIFYNQSQWNLTILHLFIAASIASNGTNLDGVPVYMWMHFPRHYILLRISILRDGDDFCTAVRMTSGSPFQQHVVLRRVRCQFWSVFIKRNKQVNVLFSQIYHAKHLYSFMETFIQVTNDLEWFLALLMCTVMSSLTMEYMYSRSDWYSRTRHVFDCPWTVEQTIADTETI